RSAKDGGCLAINKMTGNTDLIDCKITLPTICRNEARQHVHLLNEPRHQIKINLSIGHIQGWRDQNAFRFVGIPYAEPPIGEHRFAKPIPKASLNTKVWDATKYGSVCPQMPLLPDRHGRNKYMDSLISMVENAATEDEDCLNLNVYTPSLKSAGQPGLPVIVYVHGGGYSSFSSSTAIINPGHMVARGGVVVVTINYRLGLLGWLENTKVWDRSSVPGNQAIHDLILALRWVKDNIVSFGGDPNRVTVMGESSGAVSVRALLSAPSTWDLYQNAILESDPIALPFKPASMAAKETEYFMEELGCKLYDINCARNASITNISNAQLRAFDRALNDNRWTTFGLVYRPVIDDDLIALDFAKLVEQGLHNTKANILWGTMHDEAGLYASFLWKTAIDYKKANITLQELLDQDQVTTILSSTFFQMNHTDLDTFRDTATHFGTDYFWLCPLRYLSRQASKFRPVFNFRFNRGRDIPFINDAFCGSGTGRVCHSLGVQPSLGSGDAVPGYEQSGDDARYARQVMDRFTSFAKTGNPNPQPGQVGYEISNPDVTDTVWLPYDNRSYTNNPILELNLESKMSYNADFDVCDWIETELQYEFQVHAPSKYASVPDE
ncbi:hypothetical protein FBU30_003004, partial [Linnemannia zychae]